MKFLIIDDDKFERDGLMWLISKMDADSEFTDVRNGKLRLGRVAVFEKVS